MIATKNQKKGASQENSMKFISIFFALLNPCQLQNRVLIFNEKYSLRNVSQYL